MVDNKVWFGDKSEKWWVTIGGERETPHRKKGVAVDQAKARSEEEDVEELLVETREGKISDIFNF